MTEKFRYATGQRRHRLYAAVVKQEARSGKKATTRTRMGSDGTTHRGVDAQGIEQKRRRWLTWYPAANSRSR